MKARVYAGPLVQTSDGVDEPWYDPQYGRVSVGSMEWAEPDAGEYLALENARPVTLTAGAEWRVVGVVLSYQPTGPARWSAPVPHATVKAGQSWHISTGFLHLGLTTNTR